MTYGQMPGNVIEKNFGDDKTKSDFIISQMQGFNVTKNLINQELTGIFNTETLRDMNDVLQKYKVYMEGATFNVDAVNDYTPAQWRAKLIRQLIDKEARFMFAIPPDITLSDPDESTEVSDAVSNTQKFVKKVLNGSIGGAGNKFDAKLVKAAKDCLIGKRIAIATNFGKNSITVSFIPSMEFVYETDPSNVDRITKFIQFYNTVVNENRDQQRIYKKKWWMNAEDEYCWVSEEIYNGHGVLIDTITAPKRTELTWIPVEIIINDGLSGDPFGMSEMDALEDTESWYSKLASKDMDSLRKGADQITYAIDADPSTTVGLSRAPGAFWDVKSDPTEETRSAVIGTVPADMAYSAALETTLTRLRTNMFGQLDVPDTSREALQSILTNGKTMKALYWGLMVRCDEKMLVWLPAIKQTITTIIEGGKLYPEATKRYTQDKLADEYEIDVTNNYPILADEAEEKTTDMAQVNTKVMSRKSYMKKWFGYSEEECDDEIDQLVLEQQLLEPDPMAGVTADVGGGFEEDEEDPEDLEDPEDPTKV